MDLTTTVISGREVKVFTVGEESFLIGVQLARLLNKQTCNIYQSMRVKGIDTRRAPPAQVEFLARKGAVRHPAHSVTLIPAPAGLNFLAEALASPKVPLLPGAVSVGVKPATPSSRNNKLKRGKKKKTKRMKEETHCPQYQSSKEEQDDSLPGSPVSQSPPLSEEKGPLWSTSSSSSPSPSSSPMAPQLQEEEEGERDEEDKEKKKEEEGSLAQLLAKPLPSKRGPGRPRKVPRLRKPPMAQHSSLSPYLMSARARPEVYVQLASSEKGTATSLSSSSSSSYTRHRSSIMAGFHQSKRKPPPWQVIRAISKTHKEPLRVATQHNNSSVLVAAAAASSLCSASFWSAYCSQQQQSLSSSSSSSSSLSSGPLAPSPLQGVGDCLVKENSSCLL